MNAFRIIKLLIRAIVFETVFSIACYFIFYTTWSTHLSDEELKVALVFIRIISDIEYWDLLFK